MTSKISIKNLKKTNTKMYDAVPYTLLKLLFAAIDQIDNRCMQTRMIRIAVEADIDRLLQLHRKFSAAVRGQPQETFFVYAEFQLTARLKDLLPKAAKDNAIGLAPLGFPAFLSYAWLYNALTRLALCVRDKHAFEREKQVLYFRVSDHIVPEHALIFGSFARITVQEQVLDNNIRWDFDRGHAYIV